MSLKDLYNELSEESKASLGKGSSKITQSGTHLVTIESMMVIDESRVKVDFKNASGQTIDLTGFLTDEDHAKQKAKVKRVMNMLAQMCTAAGVDLKSVFAKSVTGTVDYKSGTVSTEEYPTIRGKKLYITTYTEVEADQRDIKKTWDRQVVDSFKFFDTKKRNGLEISSEADEGTTMEAADEEAKSRVEAAWRSRNNAAVQARVAVLLGGKTTNTAAGDTTNVPDEDI